MKMVIAAMSVVPWLIACAPDKSTQADKSSASARHLCWLMNMSHKMAKPCLPIETERVIKAFASLSIRDANEACDGISRLSHGRGFRFDEGWFLEIREASRGDDVILAKCPLHWPS